MSVDSANTYEVMEVDELDEGNLSAAAGELK